MNTKKVYSKLVIFALAIFSLFLAPSCSPKSGCPASDNATAQVNRKGELSMKRGKSQLFNSKAVKVKKAKKKRKKQRQKKYAKRRS
ncbi:MAG: hypothetical protein AAFP82_22500 [Bacteroidota bacterium]